MHPTIGLYSFGRYCAATPRLSQVLSLHLLRRHPRSVGNHTATATTCPKDHSVCIFPFLIHIKITHTYTPQFNMLVSNAAYVEQRTVNVKNHRLGGEEIQWFLTGLGMRAEMISVRSPSFSTLPLRGSSRGWRTRNSPLLSLEIANMHA